MNFTRLKKFAVSLRRKLAAAFSRAGSRRRQYFLTEVSPGETIDFAGEVIEGSGLVDESAQVGVSEMATRSAEAGHNQVLAGSVLRAGHLTVRCKQQAALTGKSDIEELRGIVLVNLNILLAECAELGDLAAEGNPYDAEAESLPSADIVAAKALLKQVDANVLELARRFGLAAPSGVALGESNVAPVQMSRQSLEEALSAVFKAMNDVTKVRNKIGPCQGAGPNIA